LVALLAVIVQGVMGGLRVNRISTALAAVHGGFAQAFFGLMVALCVMTGRDWCSAGRIRPDPCSFRRRTLWTLCLVCAQIALGAWLRHYKSIPALWFHLILALAVLGHVAVLAARMWAYRRELPSLWSSTSTLTVVTSLQLLLGAFALWLMLPLGGNPRTPTLWQAMLRTAHQTNGALLLAASVTLALKTYHTLGPARLARGDAQTPPHSPDRILSHLETVA
jgi:cytochrome c oxidase assembly protein subunit 15